jgi:hypothetical protein
MGTRAQLTLAASETIGRPLGLPPMKVRIRIAPLW